MAMTQDFITGTAKLFPQIYMANQNNLFSEWAKGFNKDPRRFLESMQQAEQEQMIQMAQMGGQPGAPEGGQMSGPTPAPPLPQLSGT